MTRWRVIEHLLHAKPGDRCWKRTEGWGVVAALVGDRLDPKVCVQWDDGTTSHVYRADLRRQPDVRMD